MDATSFFKRYFIAFDKYKWFSLTSFFIVVGASGVVALHTKANPTYVATGPLAYNGSPANGNQNQQPELRKDVLITNELIENVAQEVQTNVEQMRENLNVDLPERTSSGELKTPVITVRYKDTEPQRAKKTLLAVMRRMEQQSGENNRNGMQSIKKNINDGLEDIEKELKEAENSLAEHGRIQNSESIGVVLDNLLKAIADNQNQKQQIQQKLASINAQTRLGSPFSKAFVTSDLSTDPSLAKHIDLINQTESQLADLESTFLPTHPKVINLRLQLKAYKEILQRRVAQGIITLQQQQNSLKQSEAKLRQQYASALGKQQGERILIFPVAD